MYNHCNFNDSRSVHTDQVTSLVSFLSSNLWNHEFFSTFVEDVNGTVGWWSCTTTCITTCLLVVWRQQHGVRFLCVSLWSTMQQCWKLNIRWMFVLGKKLMSFSSPEVREGFCWVCHLVLVARDVWMVTERWRGGRGHRCTSCWLSLHQYNRPKRSPEYGTLFCKDKAHISFFKCIPN